MKTPLSALSLLRLTVLIILLGASLKTHDVVTGNNLAGLRGLDIRAFGDLGLDPGSTLRLTAEGDYTTYTVPLRAVWTIRSGGNLGAFIGRCDSTKTCDFLANAQIGGDVRVHAEASGFSDEITIHIQNPKPEQPVEHHFIDVVPVWAGEPIVELSKRGILQGYDDGRFGASDRLTRGQLVTIFARVLTQNALVGNAEECEQYYADVPKSHFAFASVCLFRNFGWLDSLRIFGVDDYVSRGEAASLVSRVLGPSLLQANDTELSDVLNGGQHFTDVPVSHMYFGDIATVDAVEIMQGNPDGTFGVESSLNRAEAATVFWRLIEVVQ